MGTHRHPQRQKLRYWIAAGALALGALAASAADLEPVLTGPTKDLSPNVPVGNGSSGSSGCTYNLISKKVVSTAAHCIPGGEADASVRLRDGRQLQVHCTTPPQFAQGVQPQAAWDFALCAVTGGNASYASWDDDGGCPNGQCPLRPKGQGGPKGEDGGAKPSDGKELCFSSKNPQKGETIDVHGCAQGRCNTGKATVVGVRDNVIEVTRDEGKNATPNSGDSGGLVLYKGMAVSVVSSSRGPEGGPMTVDTYPSTAHLKPFIDGAAKRLGVQVCWDKGAAPDGGTPSPEKKPDAEDKPNPGGNPDVGRKPDPAPSPRGAEPKLALELELKIRIATHRASLPEGVELSPHATSLVRRSVSLTSH